MQKKLEELTHEELLKRAKVTKLFFGIYLGLLIVMIVSSAIITFRKGINLFTFLPLFFLGISVIFIIPYINIKKELQSRNLK
jgi:uncharacterized membrane protein YjjP (DUF1212 family)